MEQTTLELPPEQEYPEHSFVGTPKRPSWLTGWKLLAGLGVALGVGLIAVSTMPQGGEKPTDAERTFHAACGVPYDEFYVDSSSGLQMRGATARSVFTIGGRERIGRVLVSQGGVRRAECN